MDKDAVQRMSFEIVAHAGEATSHFYNAIGCAREGRFDEVNAELELGNEEIVCAHKAQTDLLRCEVTGEDVAFSLLLVHAQDHLMTTILFERMAREFVEVYREMKRDE